MRIIKLSLLFAAVLMVSCGGTKQVGVITKPTSATTNLEGHEYPKINPDLSAIFRNDFPDAKTVTVNVGGKNYPMTKGEDGIWEVTTDPLVVGFHYYTMNVDGKRVSDPNSKEFYGSNFWQSGIDVPEAGVDYYLEKKVPHGEIEIVKYQSKLTGAEHHDANVLGYIQHKPLVWDNEPARHKLLDIIGDMALIGRPLKGRIIATRPGHTVNNKFARLMRKEIRKFEIQAPVYDPNKPALMDNNRIKQLLPHRYPMQLVDKVIELKEKSIVAIKNITANEPFFQGHFPQEPVMPGVLILEAMAQAGGLYILGLLDEPERYSTYFLRIDNARFRQKVVPGDTLIMKCKLLAPLNHNIATMQAYAFVGENCVAEATFMAQVIKNK